ncbi:MAG TPA: peptidoglycan bridge formation glycyltransferase FemA/FemB family protein [Candidatus Doudnabacteria bacterium]|nr:peptidoglycan bridge formation glycyltransferase FemA/FemB family protein [Candidatus Doudnabacteria bacterium]
MLKEIAQQTEYDALLASQGASSFLQSWEWGEFQKLQGQKIFRYAFENENTEKITAQFIEQIVPHLGGKYLYCPYGPVGNLASLPAFISELKKQFPNHWLIRVEPQSEYPDIGQITIRIQPGKTLVTDLSKSLEQLLKEMHNKTRYNIKVAQKHNVKIKTAATKEEFEQALDLIISTSRRQNFSGHPRSYYEKLISSSQVNAKVYNAHWQDKLLASIIIIDYKDTRTYLFGASSDEHKNVMAPYLIHWQAMQDAKEQGLQFYDWWGVETSTGKQPGFVNFKLRWGGREISYPVAQDAVTKPVHYMVYKILRQLNRMF